MKILSFSFNPQMLLLNLLTAIIGMALWGYLRDIAMSKMEFAIHVAISFVILRIYDFVGNYIKARNKKE